jgi:hypothetical protein
MDRFWLVLVFGLNVPVAMATDMEPTGNAIKSSYQTEGFAAPSSTVRQLEEDDEEKTPVMRWPTFDEALKPWSDGKKRLRESSGLQLGLAYTVTTQKANATLTDVDSGTTGIFRVSGK